MWLLEIILKDDSSRVVLFLRTVPSSFTPLLTTYRKDINLYCPENLFNTELTCVGE